MVSMQDRCDETVDAALPSPLPEFVRLFLVPFAISLLVVGGGYWLREVATDSASPERTAPVQVSLIIPTEPIVRVAKAPAQLIAPGPGARLSSEVEEQDRPADEETPVSAPPNAPAPAESVRASREAPVPKPLATLRNSAATNFQRTLLRHIEHYQNYPSAARRLRLQGTVVVLFSMRRDGAVLDVRIKTSSGATILDEEAGATIRRAQPLPPIPPELPERLNIIVPVAFNLS